MSNSSLVNCTVLSPNHSGTRTQAIDRITPHCVVGQLSAEGIGACFPAGRDASCNYGIGKDGKVCLIVDESKRSWCTSSGANDQRAVTIEVASDSTSPYAFTSAAYNKLVDLCVDICRRNGKSKLLWFGDKNKTLGYSPAAGEMVLTVHRWFANKSCPGDWMYARMGDLASSVTSRLGGGTGSTPQGSFSDGGSSGGGGTGGGASSDGGSTYNSTSNSTYSEISATAVKEMVTDLFNWNIKNNVFENGTIVVKGKAKYKVGQRILVKSTGIEYYVESVSHNFNCYGTWTTSLGVTRGIVPDKRFTKPWGCAEEMSYKHMSAIVNQTSGAKIDWNNLPEVSPPSDTGTGGWTGTGGGTGGSGGSGGGTGGGKPVTSGSLAQNEKGCYQFLTGTMGLNHAAACGALANINAESSFSTGAIGDSGTSYGICQWHNGRMTSVQNYCRSKGLPIDSLQGQLEWMLVELSGSYYGHVLKHLKSVPNTKEGAYSAASYWCIHYEVPANRYNVAVSRGNTAKNTYFPKSY